MEGYKTLVSGFSLTRRRVLDSFLLALGSSLTFLRMPTWSNKPPGKETYLLGRIPDYPSGWRTPANLVSWRLFTAGDPGGSWLVQRLRVVSSIQVQEKFLTLDPLEQRLVLTAAAGNTGWHYMIYRDDSYAPHFSNYSAAAGGRTFPSPAGWEVADFFYTDDKGVYSFSTRDAPSLMERNEAGQMGLNSCLFFN